MKPNQTPIPRAKPVFSFRLNKPPTINLRRKMAPPIRNMGRGKRGQLRIRVVS
ncbi:MAG: hypothetical protein V1880_03920 [Patescibacteria group bacterium]